MFSTACRSWPVLSDPIDPATNPKARGSNPLGRASFRRPRGNRPGEGRVDLRNRLTVAWLSCRFGKSHDDASTTLRDDLAPSGIAERPPLVAGRAIENLQ